MMLVLKLSMFVFRYFHTSREIPVSQTCLTARTIATAVGNCKQECSFIEIIKDNDIGQFVEDMMSLIERPNMCVKKIKSATCVG